MFCTKCGKKIPDDSKLCCYCGTTQTRKTHIFCPHCGQKIPANSKLCCYCGTEITPHTAPKPAPVKEAPKPAPAKETPKPEVVAPPAPEPAVVKPTVAETAPAEEKPPVTEEPKETPAMPQEEAEPTTPASKKKLWIRIGAAAMALLLLVSLFLVLYTQVFTVELWVLTAEYYDVPEEYQANLGKEVLLCSYEYDKQGNLIKKVDGRQWALGGDPEQCETYTYEYNSNGDCIRIEIDHGSIYDSIDPNMPNTVWEYEYDYDTNLKTEKYQIVSGKETLSETYEYDGKKLTRIILGDFDSLNYEYREFDKEGRLIEWGNSQYNTDEQVAETRQRNYSYDKKGRLTNIEYYYNDVFTREEEICYDEKGHIKKVVDPNSDEVLLEYETDNNGNIVYCAASETLTYTYEYRKIRVTKKQALKLIGENCHIFNLGSWQSIPYAFQYRIEE